MENTGFQSGGLATPKISRTGEAFMARVCQGHVQAPRWWGTTSPTPNNKTKRRFLPNLQYASFWLETENAVVRLRITNAALRPDRQGRQRSRVVEPTCERQGRALNTTL
jgi:large subunit ribosomal protein L28